MNLVRVSVGLLNQMPLWQTPLLLKCPYNKVIRTFWPISYRFRVFIMTIRTIISSYLTNKVGSTACHKWSLLRIFSVKSILRSSVQCCLRVAVGDCELLFFFFALIRYFMNSWVWLLVRDYGCPDCIHPSGLRQVQIVLVWPYNYSGRGSSDHKISLGWSRLSPSVLMLAWHGFDILTTSQSNSQTVLFIACP